MFAQQPILLIQNELKPLTILDFDLPAELEASEPPEARGFARDEVRLMVSYRSDNRVVHTQFRNIADVLGAGDLLVINTSGTLNAALPATRKDGTALELHLSTHLPADVWIVEIRQPDGTATKPFYNAKAGETLHLPGGAAVTLHAPYFHDGRDQSGPYEESGYTQTGKTGQQRADHGQAEQGQVLPLRLKSKAGHPNRLWIATLNLPDTLENYLAQYGFPIRYGYVKQDWPTSYYQNVYTTEMGSAEMPSAGRAFTAELITHMVARGIQFAPLILHTGVASLEEHEPPYEEFYRVPLETAHRVNDARRLGKRIIAVGTTVVRALETVTDTEGTTHPGEGWTRLVITPQRGIFAVNGLLTGLHEPQASHLSMLEALTGLEHLQVTYAEALRERYLWHEFGDLHLILP